MQKYLISLVMIVKDEVASIAETISSCQGAIDHILILDTGSTDRTQATAADAAKELGIPLELYEEPFVDFATTRNRALDLLGHTSPFSLMLSGDETIDNPCGLRASCKANLKSKEGAYHVKVRLGSTIFDSARVARTSAEYRYVGAVHEVLRPTTHNLGIGKIPDVTVTHAGSERKASRDRERWARDLVLLRKAVEANPKDTRSVFYLAQTLQCLGENAMAAQAYKARIALGGWEHELFEAFLRLGKLTADPAEAERYFREAWQLAPYRAEPLYEIASLAAKRGEYSVARLVLKAAIDLPIPDKGLFIDESVYLEKIPALARWLYSK